MGEINFLPPHRITQICFPSLHSQIVVSLVNGRPGAMNFSYSPLLRNFTKATNIRLRFLQTNTLLGHLMGKALRDPTVTRRVRQAWIPLADEVEVFEGYACHLWGEDIPGSCPWGFSLGVPVLPTTLKASAVGATAAVAAGCLGRAVLSTSDLKLGNTSWCHVWLSGCAGRPGLWLVGSVSGGGSHHRQTLQPTRSSSSLSEKYPNTSFYWIKTC